MKPNNTKTVYHHGTSTDEIKMQLDQNALSHLMSVLTDLYSSPVLACIREYSTNALDSHIEAGNPDPIRVTLPTNLKPNFVVQDFGIGLDVADLRDTFSMYGRSTKRESDEVNGTLGLGCKSGLTYTLSFTITAVKHGLMTVAAITKDDQGVGTIRILDTSATDEPNGVTINIPVKAQDVQKFRTEAEDFFRYWRGGVLLDGEVPEFSNELVWLDDDVAVVNDQHNSRITMGMVPYPLDNGWNNHSILAWVPMGAVNFVPSREALHHTTRTTEAIKTLKEFVEERFGPALLKHIENAESPFEKLKIILRWRYASGAKGVRDVYGPLMLPTGRPAFTCSSGRASKIESRLDLRMLVDYHDTKWVITEFPFRGVSSLHKERLKTLDISNAIFLPEDVDLSHLEGRPNVITWDEILIKTPMPKRAKGQAAVYAGPSYDVWASQANGGGYTTKKLDTTCPVVYRTDRSVNPPTQWRYNPGPNLTNDMFPEAHIVELYKRQVDKFLRLHPDAILMADYYTLRKKEAESELSPDERLFLSRGGINDYTVSGPLGSLLNQTLFNRVGEIDDPELKKALGVQKTGDTPKTTAARKLGVTVSPDPLYKTLVKRYPLVTGQTPVHAEIADLILYLNAKNLWLQMNP